MSSTVSLSPFLSIKACQSVVNSFMKLLAGSHVGLSCPDHFTRHFLTPLGYGLVAKNFVGSHWSITGGVTSPLEKQLKGCAEAGAAYLCSAPWAGSILFVHMRQSFGEPRMAATFCVSSARDRLALKKKLVLHTDGGTVSVCWWTESDRPAECLPPLLTKRSSSPPRKGPTRLCLG